MKKSQYNQILDSYISGELEGIREHEEIVQILLPLEGKQISGRVLNPSKLGKYTFKAQFGMFYICGQIEHLIGYEGGNESTIQVNETPTHRGFEYLDNCSGNAARERVKQIEALREKGYKHFFKVFKAFEALRLAFGDLEREGLSSYRFPAYYDILGAIQGETNPMGAKLSDFYYIKK
jgi:hypothetical protein